MHSEAATSVGEATVKVSQDQAIQLHADLVEFEKLYQQDKASFHFSEVRNYYITSVKFLTSWRDFCMSHDHNRTRPLPINLDLLNPTTQRLIPGLKEGEDFELLGEEAYKFFLPMAGTHLLRRAVTIGHEKRVPIYLNGYKYLIVTNLDLKQIDQKVKKRLDFELKEVEESENATVDDLVAKINELQTKLFQENHQLRLWRVDHKESLDSLFDYLKKAADRATYEYRIKGFGKKLNGQTKIEDLQMEEGDFFVVEAKEKGRRWFLQSDNEKKCEGCYDVTELKFPCRCEKVAYCTEACKQKDKKFHLRACEYAEMEELNKPIDLKLNSSSMKGVVGLRNLGNTCFMNSCLQCLSNTLPLTQYFLNSCFEAEVNRTNPLGTKGKLAKSYAKFIKGMWCDTDNVFTPDGIKSAVSSINPMFSGYAQHDSQQFFSFLIDGLHEDLNRIEKKPYVESVESNNRPDQEVALQSWLVHIRRNQSIITDLMTGQYKSKVTCPTCNKESITFDPFITVTLPIPQKVINVFDGFVFYRNFQGKTKRISFGYSKPNVEEWTRTIAKMVDLDEKSLFIYLVSINEGIYRAGRESLSEIVYKMENESKNIFVVQLTQEELSMKQRVELTGRFSKKGYYSDYENVWFKFPFFFEKETATGLTIYKRMLKFLYAQAYNDSKNRSKLFGGKSYEDYEGIMLNKRPFDLYLRYGKKLDRFYNRLEFKFDEQIKITDETTLKELLAKIDQKDCELDMRFTKTGLSDFSTERLKDFDDQTKKIKTTVTESDAPVQLDNCFYNLSESEQLEAGNQWYCPNCKEHKQANKQMSVYKAPKILILHLKRFKQKGILRKEKNETKVNFPPLLDMAPYLQDPLPMSSYQQEPKLKDFFIPPKYPQDYTITCSEKPIYELYAVSNHYGGLGGGHYTAYAKNGDKWYDFNDSSVRAVSESSIVGSGAYILFYRRKD